MQKDLDHLLSRKRMWHRVVAVIVICIVAAFVIASLRACSDQFNQPYNRDYKPLDESRKQTQEGGP